MSRSLARRGLAAPLLLALAAASAGCAHEPRAPGSPTTRAPTALLVPASYRARLITARRCAYLGAPLTRAELDGMGGNVGLGYVHRESSSTWNQVTTSSDAWTHVAGLRCPADVVQALGATAGPLEGEP